MSTGNSNVDARCDQNVTNSGIKGGTAHDSFAPPSRHTRRETLMCVTHLVINESGEGEEVKEVGEKAPDVGIAVFSETFIIKAINLCDLPGFVVPAKDGDPVAIAQLHCNQQCHGLDGIVSTINVVAHEEVVCVWRVAANSEELREIVLIAVSVRTARENA